MGSTLRSSLKPSGTQSESQVTDTEEHPGVSGKSVSQGSPDKTEEERSTEKMNETNLKKEDNIAIQQPFRPVSVGKRAYNEVNHLFLERAAVTFRNTNSRKF